MIVSKEDLDSDINPLPVRKGCWGGPCACTGTCQKVVGEIERNRYTEFIKNYISPEEWLEQNMVKLVPKPPDYHNKKYSIWLRSVLNIRTKFAEKKMGFHWDRNGHFEIIGIKNLSEFLTQYQSIDENALLEIYPDLNDDEVSLIDEYRTSNNIQ